MKTIILLSMLLLLNHIDYAQTQQTKTPKVSKEEKKEDSKSSKYGERTAYLFTFKDGVTGKLWQAKDDGMWWGSSGMKDKGPFSKDDGLKWLWEYKNSQHVAVGAAVVGAAAVGGAVVSHGSSKTQTPSSSGTKRTSINLTKKK